MSHQDGMSRSEIFVSRTGLSASRTDCLFCICSGCSETGRSGQGVPKQRCTRRARMPALDVQVASAMAAASWPGAGRWRPRRRPARVRERSRRHGRAAVMRRVRVRVRPVFTKWMVQPSGTKLGAIASPDEITPRAAGVGERWWSPGQIGAGLAVRLWRSRYRWSRGFADNTLQTPREIGATRCTRPLEWRHHCACDGSQRRGVGSNRIRSASLAHHSIVTAW